MDAPVTAPPVVAVVVTWNPGPWFEESLEALSAQDYPNLSVLVLDAGSDEDPTPRVASVLPGAFVRRLESNPGFAAAANEVLHVVEGASHFLICHDDVAPDPDAVRLLVEEAFRSNAGIVSPKLVDWDDPLRLLQVGMTADKTGVAVPLVERGELDQEQHDAVRDVFVAPSACALVRADLFQSLGGFDPVMTVAGEDVDLSWRAQVIGARVVVAPAARVRHFEALSRGLRPLAGDRSLDALRARHANLAMRKCYGPWHLLRVAPQAMLATALHALVLAATGHRRDASDAVDAWRWNRRNRKRTRAARRAVQTARTLGDAEVRRLQTSGLAGISLFGRGRRVGDDTTAFVDAANRGLAALRVGPTVLAAIAVTVVLVVGSRGLLGGQLAAIGELAPFPDSPTGFLRLFASGWRTHGLGADATPPPAFAFLGLGGMVLAGAMGTLQKLLVLACIPLGLTGMLRLARPLGSAAASIAALVVYACIPVPYNALATGRLSGLVAYAVAPWALLLLLHASASEPYESGEPSIRSRLVPFSLVVAVAAALAPSLLLVVAVVGLGLAAGGALAARSMARPLLLAVAGVGVAVALLLPWSLELLRRPPPAIGPDAIGAILRFETGPLGAAPLGWAFLVAAALPLVVGGGWRLPLAVTMWTGALSCFALAWVVGRGWAPLPLNTAEVALAPAAVCLAVAVALGVRAFEVDLPGYHFGWRQFVSGVAAAAVALGVVPVLGAALEGRWHQPRTGPGTQLAWMTERRNEGGFRVLWVGRPRDLPLHSWSWRNGLAYATSRDGPPDATALWPGAPSGASPALAQALDLAASGRTQQLGRLLAPMAVRYLVLPSRPSPGRAGRVLPAQRSLQEALVQQVDLGRVETDDSLEVFVNAAWVPSRAAMPEGSVPTESRLRTAALTPLTGAQPALGGSSPLRASGAIEDHTDVIVSESPSARWQLDVAGVGVVRHPSFGVANVYSVDQGGTASLRYRTSPLRYLVIALQTLAWSVAVGWCVRTWRARRRTARAEPAFSLPEQVAA